MSVATPLTTVEPQAESAPRTLLRFDPLLLVAALGLVACSLITLKGATKTTNPGHPMYYVERQAVYAGIGVVLAIVLSRIDYSRCALPLRDVRRC